jgi:hypothetical protein
MKIPVIIDVIKYAMDILKTHKELFDNRYFSGDSVVDLAQACIK